MSGFPYPRTDLSNGFRDGNAERGEAVEYGDTDLELHNLTVEVPRGQALAQAGDLPLAGFRAKHVEALMEHRNGPAAANKVRKNLSMLFKHAIKLEVEGVTVNPTKVADRMREGDERFHTWTASEMAQFLKHHETGSKARLVFMLALNTGAARADLCRMTWGNIRDGRISYKRGKTKIGGDYPILPDLGRELALLPRDAMVLIHHGKGLPYKP